MKHKIKIKDYEKIWGRINSRNTNFYIIVHNVQNNTYTLHKDDINGFVKISSATDPFLLLKKCK